MIQYKQNLHTHTTYCDGSHTPEEIVKQAIEIGFDTIGFSGHATMNFGVAWDMSREDTLRYKEEVARLKEKYHDRIRVLCGLEVEMLAEYDPAGYDYLIGSSHFMKIGEEIVEFDATAQTVSGVIERYFGGDGIMYARHYYENLAELPRYGRFDIVGHFDIIAKHCESHHFFDVTSKAYQTMALESLHAVAEKMKVFEVNTGAIARGYRTLPYPAPFLLKEMKNLGCSVVLTSDCHNKNALDCHYAESLAYIQSCGFDRVGVMDETGIKEVKI